MIKTSSHVKALIKIRLTKKLILSGTVRHGSMVSMEGVGVGIPTLEADILLIDTPAPC